MKKYIAYFSAIVLSAMFISACQEDPLSPESVITVETVPQNDFDKWLDANFVDPYNIDFKYRYEMNESDLNYYTVPAAYDEAIIMAHLVKYLCIDTYDEVAGIDFTRNYFPKMFFLIGEWEYRNNGTFILGTAEGGKKILLSGINYLNDVLDMGADALNHYYIKTIHHEFTHILNQTKDFSTEFGQITGSGYVADSWSEAPYNTEYLKNGFISSYAQHSDTEDFAEMLSIYVTNPQSYWDEQLKTAGNTSAELITSKLDLVRDYMKTAWSIDIDELRSTILRRQNDVIKGKIDLEDLTIK
ncbi:MAG: putative zinc-binding metallopeptidase [Bacteroidales bacterium]|nr:putative zinc-binding metallopeptidase [Bacteroidales bacterium]